MPAHIGEAAFEHLMLIAETLVVETHEMQDRGVEITDRDRIHRSLRAEFVTLAEMESLHHACDGKGTGEGVGVVIASGAVALEEGHAAELGGHKMSVRSSRPRRFKSAIIVLPALGLQRTAALQFGAVPQFIYKSLWLLVYALPLAARGEWRLIA